MVLRQLRGYVATPAIAKRCAALFLFNEENFKNADSQEITQHSVIFNAPTTRVRGLWSRWPALFLIWTPQLPPPHCNGGGGGVVAAVLLFLVLVPARARVHDVLVVLVVLIVLVLLLVLVSGFCSYCCCC